MLEALLAKHCFTSTLPDGSASSSAVAAVIFPLAPRAVVHGRQTSEDDRVTVALEKAITTCPPLRLSRSRWPATASLDQLNSITVTQRPKIKDHTGYGSRATPKQGFAGAGREKRERREEATGCREHN